MEENSTRPERDIKEINENKTKIGKITPLLKRLSSLIPKGQEFCTGLME